MKLLISLSLILLSSAALSQECVAEKRVPKTQTGPKVYVKKLKVTEETPYYQKLTADIGQTHYTVTIQDNTVTSMIVLGPDYTHGNLSKGSFDENGQLKLTHITENEYLILNCKK